MQATASGEVLHDLQLDVTSRYQLGEQVYFTYKLRDVIVSSIFTSGNTEETEETVALNYSRIDWQYWQFRDDGTTGSQSEAWWDVERNVGEGTETGGGDTGGGGGGGGTTNYPPVIQPIADQQMQPAQSTVLTVSVSDQNDSVDSLSVWANTNNTDLVKNLSVTGTGGQRSLSFSVSSLYSGSASVNVFVSDGKASRSVSFAVTVGVELTPFESFLTAYFSSEELGNPVISGPLQDPDKDGIVTLVEYALVTNPREFTYPEEAVQIRRESRAEGEFLVINYRRRTDDPNVGPIPWMAPESLGRFSSLHENPLYEESAQAGENPLYEDVEGSINIGDGAIDQHFIRMQVSHEQ